MLKEQVLGPLIAVALVFGVIAVAWSSMRHHRPEPLLLTIAGSVAIAAGRLLWNVPALVSAGGATVLGASIWNLWLSRSRQQHTTIRLARRKGEMS